MTDVFPVHTTDRAALDVVFLHGLNGDARKTWSRGPDHSFWPQWLVDDVDDLSVWTVNYDAWSSGWRGRTMSLQDRAINLLAQLQANGLGDRPLCLIGHSMGGLLVKEMLLHAAEGRTEFGSLATATRGVVFLATPHTGSGVTQAVKALGKIYRATAAVDDLKRNGAHLRHLSDRYRDWIDATKIPNLVFFETHTTMGVQVVDASSANPGLALVRPIPVDADHGDICKPESRTSLVYAQVLRFVRKLAGQQVRRTPLSGQPPRQSDGSAFFHGRFRPKLDHSLFIGRGPEIASVTEAVNVAEGNSEVHVFAFDGMPGVGKSTLTEHIAATVSDRFDGRVFDIDLLGHTAGRSPADPYDIMYKNLAYAGEDVTTLAGDRGGLSRAWQNLLGRGRSVLLLDNAATSEQVQPLLPRQDVGCLVLITSRQRLSWLVGDAGAILSSLRPFGDDDAVEQLERMARRRILDEERIAAFELVELAGRLPLAIAIAAARLHDVDRTVRSLLVDVKAARDTLHGLEAISEGQRHIIPLFQISYAGLSSSEQATLRKLGLHPGKRIDAPAAAALSGSSHLEARHQLTGLNDNSLLSRSGEHYVMHDLVRDYVRQVAGSDRDHHAALDRLIGYYQHTAAAADRYLARHNRPPVVQIAPPSRPPAFENREGALAWIRGEIENIEACIDHAVRHREDRWVVALTGSIAAFMRNDGPWYKAEEFQVRAVESAQRLGDAIATANALSELSFVQRLMSRFASARESITTALGIYREIGSALGEANALSDLGILKDIDKDSEGSIEDFHQALIIYHALGERLGRANVHNDLGVTLRGRKEYAAAAASFHKARDCYRHCGNELGEAHALYQLGIAQRAMTESANAAVTTHEVLTTMEQALTRYRKLGNRLGEANTLTHIAGLQAAGNRLDDAVRTLDTALDVHVDIGNRRGEALALRELSKARHRMDQVAAAIRALERCLELCRESKLPERDDVLADLETLRAAPA